MVSPVFYDSKVRYMRVVLWRFCVKLIRFYSLKWSRSIGYLDSTLFWDLFVIDGCDCSRLLAFILVFYFGLLFIYRFCNTGIYILTGCNGLSCRVATFIHQKWNYKIQKKKPATQERKCICNGNNNNITSHAPQQKQPRKKKKKGKKRQARKVRTCLHLAWMYEWSESAHDAIFASDLQPSRSVLEGSDSLRGAAGPDRGRKRVADKLVATKSWLYYVEAGGVASS